MDNYTVNELTGCLASIPFTTAGSALKKTVTRLSTPEEATGQSLIWISPTKKDKESLITASRAQVIVCDSSVKTDLFPERFFIITQDPKLAFLRIGNTLFKIPPQTGIHPTAVIHPEAKLAENVSVGPFTYIGRCEIDEGTIIHGHCHLYDGTVIRKNVFIHAGCIIGATGLGHLFNEEGILENFPQIGNVILEENSELGAGCIVLKGALSSTKIGKNTKIDCHVIVGHNVIVGENTLIAANSVLGGSCFIGNEVFVGIGATIIDYIRIEEKAHIGAGTIIVEDIRKNTRIIARPSIILPTSLPNTEYVDVTLK